MVCVADLGRGPRWRAELMRVGRDGRFGLRLSEPGTGRRESALDYRALGEERQAAEAAEERRLFYVAMTRARERLILSGAAKLDAWPDIERPGGGGGPITWIAPAVADLDGVAVTFVAPGDLVAPASVPPAPAPQLATHTPSPAPPPSLPESAAAPPVAALSYSSLAEYHRCGYRFYAERVLRLPPRPGAGAGVQTTPGALSATERGTLVHALLERLDFRRPAVVTEAAIANAAARFALAVAPGGADAAEIIERVERFAEGDLCRRLGRATGVRRGAVQVPARRRWRAGRRGVRRDRPRGRREGPGGRLQDRPPRRRRSAGAGRPRLRDATSRLCAGGATGRGGPGRGRVHLPRAAPAPTVAAYTREQASALEAELSALAGGVLRREFTVTDAPHRGVCDGCPAEGGLCSWPLEMTRREGADRLF